jgi:hypothetical protein
VVVAAVLPTVDTVVDDRGGADDGRGTLTMIVVVFLLAATTILPSLGLLYALDQKSFLEPDEITTRCRAWAR